jgi:hypothetical protein
LEFGVGEMIARELIVVAGHGQAIIDEHEKQQQRERHPLSIASDKLGQS